MKKIILIDDEPLARNILEEYLGSYPEFQIVATCNDGFEGFKASSKDILEWTTGSEQNNAYFNLQHGTDAIRKRLKNSV